MLPRHLVLHPHTLRLLVLRCLSILVIFALLVGPLAPVVSAQDGGDGGRGSLFLPLVNNGPGSGDEDGPAGPLQVYRTEIEVQTPAQWRTLERIAPVFLGRGDN